MTEQYVMVEIVHIFHINVVKKSMYKF